MKAKFFRSLLVALIVAMGVGTMFGAGAGVAVLGASALVKVPAGSTTGTKLCLKGFRLVRSA